MGRRYNCKTKRRHCRWYGKLGNFPVGRSYDCRKCKARYGGPQAARRRLSPVSLLEDIGRTHRTKQQPHGTRSRSRLPQLPDAYSIIRSGQRGAPRFGLERRARRPAGSVWSNLDSACLPCETFPKMNKTYFCSASRSNKSLDHAPVLLSSLAGDQALRAGMPMSGADTPLAPNC